MGTITDVQGFTSDAGGTVATGLLLPGGATVPFPGSGAAIGVINNLTITETGSALDAAQGPAIVALVGAAESAAAAAQAAANAAGDTASAAATSAAAAASDAAAAAATAAALVQTGLAPSDSRAPSVNTLNAALATVGVTTRIAETIVIPLDGSKAMPLTAGQTMLIGSSTTLTIAGGALERGECEMDVTLAAALTLPSVSPNNGKAAIVKGDALDPGYVYRITLGISAGDLVIFVLRQSAVDITAPLLGTPHIENGARTIIATPITELNTPTLNGTTANVHLSGAGASGKTVTNVAVVSGVLNVTLSAAAAFGDVINVSFDAGIVKDSSNNLSAASGSPVAVTNNIVAAPVFSDSTVANATVGAAYSDGYTASNTTSYAVTAGALPAGLSLNPTTGAITGTPTTAGTPSHTVSATGPGGTTSAGSKTITVSAGVTLALDSITTPSIGAYSLYRKLRSAYGGNACVIRSSAGGTITVGFSGNSVDWATALTALGANDAFLTTIYDQSGSARDVLQATTGQQPKIATAGVLNKQATLYPASIGVFGSDTGLVSAGFTLGATLGGATIYAAAGLLTTAGSGGIAALLAGADADDFASSNSLYVVNNALTVNSSNGTNTGQGLAVTSAATVVTCSRYLAGVNTPELWINGTAGSSGTAGIGSVGTAGAGNKLSFQSRIQGGAAAQPTNGNVMEVVYFPRLVDADRVTFESNMRTAYGV